MTKIKTKKTNKTLGSSNKNKKFNLKIFNCILFISIISLSVCYIVGVNSLSVKGFMLYEIKTGIEELNKENNNLELKIMDLEAYTNISKRADDLLMVKAQKIDYLKIGEEEVAKK